MTSVLAVVAASTCFGTDQGLYCGVCFVPDSESLSSWQPVKARKRMYSRQTAHRIATVRAGEKEQQFCRFDEQQGA
jgi:hypothetical protein